MVKSAPTKQEKDHMERVRALGCFINNKDCCEHLEVHHITGAGMGLRSSHYETICLCFNHHSAQTPLRFGHAVHKGTRTFEEYYWSQKDIVRMTITQLHLKHPSIYNEILKQAKEPEHV